MKRKKREIKTSRTGDYEFVPNMASHEPTLTGMSDGMPKAPSSKRYDVGSPGAYDDDGICPCFFPPLAEGSV